jgi:hypothetical protein
MSPCRCQFRGLTFRFVTSGVSKFVLLSQVHVQPKDSLLCFYLPTSFVFQRTNLLAQLAGKLVRTSSDATQQLSNGLPVEVGKTVRKSSVIQTQAVQPSDSGPIFGIIGVARADLDNEDISMYDDSAWTIMQNTATTLAK